MVGYPYKGRGTGVFDRLSPDGAFSDRSSSDARYGDDTSGWPVSTNRRIAPGENHWLLVTPTLRRGSSNLISAERGLMLF
jgi:hypothetical protein